MNAIIVEDEAIAARKLTRLLEARSINILNVLSSVEKLKAQLHKEEEPDLYFFDIHLSDGIVFDALAEKQPSAPIIFTTAYDQYAIKAFKQNSIDYLLKPIDEAELDAALDKFKKSQNKSDIDLNSITSMLQSMSSSEVKKYKKRFSIKIGDKLRSINIEDVLFFYSDNKINFLFCNDGRAYPIDNSIEEISNQLDPQQFFRVNRGCVVQINSIAEVIAYSNSRLKVKVAKASSHEIIVSRDRVKEFKKWLG